MRSQGNTWFRTTVVSVLVPGVALSLGLTLAGAAARTAGAPHVLTDKAAYVDGDTIKLSGYEFLPFEAVRLQLLGVDGGANPRPVGAPWTAFADVNGKFESHWIFVPADRGAMELVVMATGGSSRVSTQSAFRRTAVLTTDKPGYEPGVTTVISGSNFQPNENVTLKLVYATPAADREASREPWSVTADRDGTISSSVNVEPGLASDQSPRLIAAGDLSGLRATTLLLAGGYNIDGNVPDAGTFQFSDPAGSSSELGPVNNTTTKLLAIGGAQTPMLSFTNPNAQVDLRTIWMSTSVVNSDAWLYFGWERDSNSGSGVIAFEFQQAPRPAACDYSQTDQVDTPSNSPAGEAALVASCNPWANRQPGDFLIVWDQGGKAINIIKRTFYLDPGTGKLALDAGVILSATDSAAAVSVDKYRGEGAINLSRTVFPANPTSCFSIANIIPGTVTGNSDSADYKDTLLAEFASKVAVSNCGQLKVTKVTLPAGGTGSFPYTLARTNNQVVRFQADGGQTTLGDTLVQDGDFDLIFKLIAGSGYRLTEGAVGPAWAAQSIVCGGTDVTLGATFSLQPSLVTECTITNKLQPGTLIVKKVVANNDGGALTCGNFAFVVNGGTPIPFDADCQNEISVDATGTYTVTEPAVAGYTASYSGCSSVQVPAGGSATCTVTNDDRGPSLKLVKSVTNDNGGTGTPASWQLTASGAGGFTDSGNSSTFHGVKAAVPYTLSESSLAGYDFVQWSCNAGTFVGPNTITLGLDQQATCTVTNDDRKATPGVTTTERAVLHDAATITGIRVGAPAPAATVTFRLYSDNACATKVGADEVVPISLSGSTGTASTVGGVLVTAPGTYYWRAVYSGDAFNAGFTTACGSETTTIAF
jgi:hypothetical protein